MYNSQNLPLSKKKIIKKTINSGGMLPILILLVLFPFVSFLGSSLDFHIGGKAAFYVFLFFFIPSLLILVISVIYQWLYYKYYYYNFEQDSAEIMKGVVSRSTGHVRYGKIQNIYVDQDFLDRVFGLYDVHYETAGEFSGIYSHVDGLVKENADKLTAFLNDRVQNKDSQKETSVDSGANNKIQENITDENDQRIFTRENIPVEKKIIFANTVVMTIVYSIMLFIGVGYLSDLLVKFIGDSLMTLTFIGIIPITFVGVLIYELIWFKNFYFKFDKSGGVITEKVLSVSNTHVYFNRVQNIDVSQSTLERILGLYEVTMETASEGTAGNAITITGLKKENAETLRDFLLDKTKKYQSV